MRDDQAARPGGARETTVVDEQLVRVDPLGGSEMDRVEAPDVLRRQCRRFAQQAVGHIHEEARFHDPVDLEPRLGAGRREQGGAAHLDQ